MKIPLILYLAFYARLLPFALALVRRAPLSAARRATLAWVGLDFTMSLAGRLWVLYVDPTNNMVVTHTLQPIVGVAVLWMLAEFQVQPLARSTVRFCIPAYLLVWAIGYFVVEDRQSFSSLHLPVLAILALTSALFAFVAHVYRDDDPMLRSDWGWILPGVAIFFATNGTMSLMQAYLLRAENLDLLVRATILKGWVDVLAFIIIAGGFFWSTRALRSSGASSSPAPSR